LQTKVKNETNLTINGRITEMQLAIAIVTMATANAARQTNILRCMNVAKLS